MKETIHDRDGVRIAGPEATGNTIQGNRIGVGLAGDPLPNGSADPEARGGVYIRGAASGNTIGGTTPGAGNQIAHNLLAGVWLDSGLGNAVRGNAIHDNTGLGIDLVPGGVTANDELDTATPLTMVLAEQTGTETITYLHGLDLVAQSDGTTTEYFAYDGLGSVRQVADETGSPLLTP